MAKVIAITLYRRPAYTAKLLASLRAAHGIDDYTVLFSCDYDPAHASACDTVQEQAYQFITHHRGMGQVLVNSPKKGIDLNKTYLMPKAYQHGDYVIMLEDDTPIAQDGLRYFEAMNRMFRDDPTMISVSAYNRYTAPEEHERVLRDEPYHIDRGGQFCPWGWAMWEDRYARLIGMDGGKYLEATGDKANGLFDHNLCQLMKAEAGKAFTVYPVLPRTNHTGATEAEHTPSEKWLMDNEFSPYGAWSQDMPDPVGQEWTKKW